MDTENFTDFVINVIKNKKNDNPILIEEIYRSTENFAKMMEIDFEVHRKNLLTHGVSNHSKITKDRVCDIPYIVDSIVDAVQDIDIDSIKKQIEILNSTPQPEQRTPAWYEYRQNVITASSASHILESESTYNRYVEDKVRPEKHFSAGTACQFGIKFEDVACSIYQKLTKTKVNEYGCIRHANIVHLGASPDGIVVEANGDEKYLGRMLEIKCLYSREMHGVPLYKYWVQCQIQLETCNLAYCDFFECKLNDNLTEQDFYIKLKTNSMKEFFGVIIEYTRDCSILYKYSELNKNESYYRDFVESNIVSILEDPKQDIIKITYFELNKYSLVTIKRSHEWFASIKPKFAEFWKEVEQKREILKYYPDDVEKIFPKKTRNKKEVTEICMVQNEDDAEDEFW